MQSSLALKDGIIQANPQSYNGQDTSLIVSCAIYGGMSGGPVVDRFGKLIGIVMEETFTQPNGDLPAIVERHVVPVSYLSDLLQIIG